MPPRAARLLGIIALAAASAGVVAAVLQGFGPSSADHARPAVNARLARGLYPHPLHLLRPQAAPLSAMARLGRRLFDDPALSSSGRLACATCHGPKHDYGPANDAPAMFGGPDLARQGVRAVPSLMYLEQQPNFAIGPDNEENENVSLAQSAVAAQDAARVQKTALDTAATGANLVPQGGLFWDGRADTLQQQAFFPLLNPLEMDGGSIAVVAAKLRQGRYRARFVQLFGTAIFDSPELLVAEALSAIGRYEIEDVSFHPYTSKFDYWLEGRARLSLAEVRGYVLYNDPAKADCGGCHVDVPGPDGTPPLFTDHQYEALGAPRNPAIIANRDPAYFDLGICGPYRTDMAKQTQYCGMFATPTLRNVTTRRVFMHNGIYHSLQQVFDFYNFRDTAPQKVYPRRADGTIGQFDDLPRRYRANIDETDPPFGRKLGSTPAMTAQDEADIITFLKTLTDGYQPGS
jgi:cytochrome c peroxidase